MESAYVPSAPRTARLRYVPARELERLRGLDADPVERAGAFADACRINVLYMVMRAGSGHIGTSFSSLDVVSWLHLEVLQDDDVYFSSKGHDAPALYAVLTGLGRLDFALIHKLRRLGGLPGHPDVGAVPQVNTNTGSLGMGISKAKGFARAARLRGERRRVYVLTGDGELQEGQFWESLPQAVNEGFAEITAIVDHNKLQSDTWISEVSDLGDLEAKAAAFGWAVTSCDGNDIADVGRALADMDGEERPKLVVAHTLKGAGVSFMEPHGLERSGTSLYGWHSGAPSEEEYGEAFAELEARLRGRLEALDAGELDLEEVVAPPRPSSGSPQKLIQAYGEALAAEAARDERVVVLDADLYLDTGLIPFRERFPERFIECGIAEQDMVSQAGALALSGLVPVVHSFACFLSTRPNEQIYNNATEHTKVVYTGSLAGLVPGGPGHSHQSVRDISALGAVPGMALLEPATEAETRRVVEWALREADGPVYIRLVSVPWEVPFDAGDPGPLERGRGRVLRQGSGAVLVAAGPVMLSEAWRAAEQNDWTVVALPWLRQVDGDWLAGVAGETPIVAIDNHYSDGGQGDAIQSALAGRGRVHKVGVESVPACGTNQEVLAEHRLATDGIAAQVRELFT